MVIKKRIAEAAHGLKGEVGNLGFKTAYELTVDIEKLAKSDDYDEELMKKLTVELKEEMEKIKRFFEQEDWYEQI